MPPNTGKPSSHKVFYQNEGSDMNACVCVVFPSRISMDSLNQEKKNFELFVEEPSPWFRGS